MPPSKKKIVLKNATLCWDCQDTDDICTDWGAWLVDKPPPDGRKRCMACAVGYNPNDEVHKILIKTIEKQTNKQMTIAEKNKKIKRLYEADAMPAIRSDLKEFV